MTERDELDARLKDLAQTADWVDEPIDPATIRGLGQRRHRRRWAATGVLAALLLVVGAAGVLGVAVGPQPREPVPAGVPTPTPSPTPTDTEQTLEPSSAGSAEGTLVPRRTRSVPTYPTYAPSPSAPVETPAPDSSTPPPSSASPSEDPPTSEPEPSETTEPEPTTEPTTEPDDGGGGGGSRSTAPDQSPNGR